MSWFRKAFSISIPDSNSYYCSLYPLDFYEWKYTGSIPKGTFLTKHLPPSDTFIGGKIIASVECDKIRPHKNGFELTESSPALVSVKIGRILSASEVLNKYKELKKNFDRGLQSFKHDFKTRLYAHSITDKPHLFRFSKQLDEMVTLKNFGPVEDLTKKFSETKAKLSRAAKTPVGRSYELEDLKKYDNAMAFVNNSHLHVDAIKMDQLINQSGSAFTEMTIPWIKCYLDLSQGAQLLDEEIKNYESKTWIRDLISP